MKRLAFNALLLFAAAMPIENTMRLPVVGSLGRVAGLLLIVAAIPTFLEGRRLAIRKMTPSILLMLAFFLWSMTTLLWSVEADRTLTYLVTLAQLVALALVFWQLCRTDKHRLAVMQAYVLGASVAVADGIWNYLVGQETVYLRFSATGTDPNDYALMLAIAIPMAWELAATATSWPRYLNLLYIPAALGAVVLSASRGGALAVLVALMAIPLGYRQSSRGARRAVLVLLITTLASMPLYATSITAAVGTNISRLLSVASGISTGNLNEREVIWAAGSTVFSQRPIGGVGAGAFAAAIEKEAGIRQVAHNTYLSVLVETGAIGLMLYLGILLAAVVPLLRTFHIRYLPSLIMFATLLVGIIPLSWEIRKPTWLVVLLLVVLTKVELVRLSPRDVPVRYDTGAAAPVTPANITGLRGRS